MPQGSGQDVLAFSLSTAPDVNGARLLYGLEGLDDEDSARAMQQMAMQDRTGDALPPHLHQIKAGAVAGRVAGQFCVQVLDASQGESSIIADLCRRQADPNTCMLSYGGNRDVAVLCCRALLRGVNAPDCAHLDLAEVFTAGIAQLPPIQELLQLQGLPWVKQEQAASSELLAVQVYILYLSYQRAQGELSQHDFAQAMREIRTCLENATVANPLSVFTAWLKTWPAP